MQERPWFLEQLQPGTPAFRLSGPLSLPPLAALGAVTGRQDALRARFTWCA